MELKETIKNRRSIRKFKNIDIKKEIIEELINCARLAPSAKNRQPWMFIIPNTKVKNQIAEMMIRKETLTQIDVMKEENAHSYKSSVISTANIIKQAPILILVLKEDDEFWNDADLLSIGAAIEHICLRATDLKLGSLWIRDIEDTKKEIADFIGYTKMDIVSAISIGYASENPYERPRKKLNEILRWV